MGNDTAKVNAQLYVEGGNYIGQQCPTLVKGQPLKRTQCLDDFLSVHLSSTPPNTNVPSGFSVIFTMR